MIYLVGDIHGEIEISKLNSKNFPEGQNLTKDDYVIILGDFGLIWDGGESEQYWLNWLENQPWTTFFLDGNHENFELLNNYPIGYYNNGRVHKISNSIFHLMRGQIYTIDNKDIFVFGGAKSHDKEYRKENKNWWKEELPKESELIEAMYCLKKHNHKVDYVLTHCFTTRFENKLFNSSNPSVLTDFFLKLTMELDYSKWYFGHYHKDINFDGKHYCLYKEKVKL